MSGTATKGVGSSGLKGERDYSLAEKQTRGSIEEKEVKWWKSMKGLSGKGSERGVKQDVCVKLNKPLIKINISCD